jgi:hypothetical protein
MAVHNREKFVSQCVSSILGQTFGDFELIVIDDGSTDRTWEILSSFEDPRVQLLRNEHNQGIPRAVNRGLEAARGCYIARMDSDDECLPKRLETQYQFLERHPEIGVLGGYLRIQEVDTGRIWDYPVPERHHLIAWTLHLHNCIPNPTAMFRRELLDKVGFYDVQFPQSQDYDLWARLLWNTQFHNLPEPLVLYRQHRSAVSTLFKSNQYRLSLQIRQRLLRQLLGRDVNTDVIRNVEFSPGATLVLNLDEVDAVTYLLMETVHAYLDRAAPAPEDARAIIGEAVRRVRLVHRCTAAVHSGSASSKAACVPWTDSLPWRLKKMLVLPGIACDLSLG